MRSNHNHKQVKGREINIIFRVRKKKKKKTNTINCYKILRFPQVRNPQKTYSVSEAVSAALKRIPGCC